MQSEFGKAVAVFFFLRKAKRPSERCLLQCPAHSFPGRDFSFIRRAVSFYWRADEIQSAKKKKKKKKEDRSLHSSSIRPPHQWEMATATTTLHHTAHKKWRKGIQKSILSDLNDDALNGLKGTQLCVSFCRQRRDTAIDNTNLSSTRRRPTPFDVGGRKRGKRGEGKDYER